MVHRIISSSNLELEEERDTSNGARSLAALNVAVLGLLLITEALILVDWGPTVHGRMARSPVFMLLLASIFNVIVALGIF